MKQRICPKCFAAGPSETRRPAEAAADSPCICQACGHVFSENGGARALSVALVGAQGAGKSNYLGVLIDRLRHEAGKALGCTLYPLGGDNTMLAYERVYRQPLFVRGQCVPPTTADELEPLEYSLVFTGSGRRTGKPCSLTLYDTCGACFASQTEMEQNARSLCHARGLLFFVDPSQLPVVRDRLALDAQPVLDEDAVAILSRTIHLLRSSSGRTNMRRKLNVPIAVCITKLDTVHKMLDASSFLGRRERHVPCGGFDLADFSSCDLEARSLLEAWGGGELLSLVEAHFSHSACFGLSALGTAPASDGKLARVVPHRVTDPLLWLLWKAKLLPGK